MNNNTTVLKVCRISQMDPQTKPAVRAISYGTSSLTNDELLTLILGSHNLCKYAHRDLAEMSFEQMRQNGISTISAIKIAALREYSKRMMIPETVESFNNTDAVVSYLRPTMQNLSQEQFRVLFLNTSYKLIEDLVMTIGTCDMSLVSVREILTYGLRLGAANLIVTHNHPGGVALPSNEDHTVTDQIRAGCKAVAMNLVDHIIIGGNGDYYSFRERGFLS